MYLAQNLKYLREKQGETQKDIANMLSVSEMTICRYEKGESEPDLQKVIDIAFHFRITVDELIAKPIKTHVPLYIRNIRFLQEKYEISDKELALLLGIKAAELKRVLHFGIDNFINIANLSKFGEFFGIAAPADLALYDLSKEGEK